MFWQKNPPDKIISAFRFCLKFTIFLKFRSNLSVSAEEFVPRTMARNTSQWAYQQQQQQQPQQRQVPDYSANSYGYQPHMDYPGSNYGSTNDNNQQFDASVSTSIVAILCLLFNKSYANIPQKVPQIPPPPL